MKQLLRRIFCLILVFSLLPSVPVFASEDSQVFDDLKSFLKSVIGFRDKDVTVYTSFGYFPPDVTDNDIIFDFSYSQSMISLTNSKYDMIIHVDDSTGETMLVHLSNMLACFDDIVSLLPSDQSLRYTIKYPAADGSVKSMVVDSTNLSSFSLDWLYGVLGIQNSEMVNDPDDDISGIAFKIQSSNLKKTYILPSVDSAGNVFDTVATDAFGNQPDLYAVQIPSGYKAIQSNAFRGCSHLRTIIVPETVSEIAEDIFDSGHGDVLFIAPAGSYAAQYASAHSNIRCITLPEKSLAETDERYLTTLIYKNTTGLLMHYDKYLDYQDYLNEISTDDLILMGIADRNALAFGWLVDLFNSGEKSTYLADCYRKQMYEILETIQKRNTLKIDFKAPESLLSFAGKASDKYVDFNAWLGSTDRNEILRDYPYFLKYVEAGEKLTAISKLLGDTQDTLNFVHFTFKDYSESLAILDAIEGMTGHDSSGTLTAAINNLRNEFDEGVKGAFTYYVDELLKDNVKDFTEAGLEELLGEPFALYSAINKLIDAGLSVTGARKKADKEIEYVALMNLTDFAFGYYGDLMASNDNSPEAMERLNIVMAFINEVITRTYQAEIDLSDDPDKIAGWKDSIEYYQDEDIICHSVYDTDSIYNVVVSTVFCHEPLDPIVDVQFAVGNYVTLGSYPQTAEGTDATPIEWLVLARDGSKALLLSRYGLDAQPYNTEFSEVTWETCTLCSWLNSTFLNKAFTEKEQKAILMTDVDNSPSQCFEWNINGGNNTQNRIFLLSYAEAKQYLNVEHWSVEGAEQNMKSRVAPTAYVIQQGAYIREDYITEDGKPAGAWWLRSPGIIQYGAACVSTVGYLSDINVDYSYAAVRPALWVNLESGIF